MGSNGHLRPLELFMSQLNRTTHKWGTEDHIASNDLYSAVRLYIKAGYALPLMFHTQHDKTWYFVSGEAEVRTVNTQLGQMTRRFTKPGEIIRVRPLTPAQLVAVTDCEVLQVGNALDYRDRFILQEATYEGPSVSPSDPSQVQAPVPQPDEPVPPQA
jgi:mannose-6-phosphate isomerase-like protein (cupin superfamily)